MSWPTVDLLRNVLHFTLNDTNAVALTLTLFEHYFSITKNTNLNLSRRKCTFQVPGLMGNVYEDFSFGS